MLHAAKALAATALDAIHALELLDRAKAELRERTDGKPYVCPIPPDVQPASLRVPAGGRR
jgi:aminobenzoyl-glutamate utilization protein B